MSRELGTRLTGRYLFHEMFTFWYAEFLAYSKKADSNESFADYLNLSGFPEYLREQNPEVLQNLLKDIVFRDIAIRYSIKNTKTLMDITLFLISKNPKKIYCIDTYFAKANSLSFSKDQSQLLENPAYLLLRKANRKSYYFRERKECDFVVFEDKSYKWLIQVTEKVHVNNQQRELNGLLEAMTFFGKTEGFIPTLEQIDFMTFGDQTV